MLPSGRQVILSDTVGFIDALPPTLIKAFQVASVSCAVLPFPATPAHACLSAVGLCSTVCFTQFMCFSVSEFGSCQAVITH